MHYTHPGRTRITVSRLCLGTVNSGPETSEENSFAIIDPALESGINFFDTANMYGWKLGEGVTERIVGRWLADRWAPPGSDPPRPRIPWHMGRRP